MNKILTLIMKTGKSIIGYKEVQKSVRGSKLIVYSSQLSMERKKILEDDCKSKSIPSIEYDGSSFELGLACRRNFRISALAVKSSGDADLSSLDSIINS